MDNMGYIRTCYDKIFKKRGGNTNSRLYYVQSTPEKFETILSGITFEDFIDHTPIPIKNMLILKGDYRGGNHWNGFELLQGNDKIDGLKRKNIYNYGDFCFVDYKNDTINLLTETQIAELLYLGHFFKPLKSPFFEEIQNNFAYLSHDDGWYCKLYSKDMKSPIIILCNKIRKDIQDMFYDKLVVLQDCIFKSIEELSDEGLLIELIAGSKILQIKYFVVGEYENPDNLFNSFDYSTEPIEVLEVKG